MGKNVHYINRYIHLTERKETGDTGRFGGMGARGHGGRHESGLRGGYGLRMEVTEEWGRLDRTDE